MSDYQNVTQQESTNKSNQSNHSILGHEKSQSEGQYIERQDIGAFHRLMAEPFSASSQDLLSLQPVIGNRALGQIIQAKLSVGPARNHYEQEADQVAEKVTSHAGSQNITPAKGNLKTHSIAHLSQQTSSQSMPPHSGVDEGFKAAQELEKKLKSSKGRGRILPDNTRNFMESQMGSDFGQVRVHTGYEAGQLNQGLSAEAFTHGNDIYMARGRYQPESKAGQQLLAHELTHVVQQGGLAATNQPSQTVQCQRNWLSRLLGLGKKDRDEQPALQPATRTPATPPGPTQWQSARPQHAPVAPPVTAQWVSARPQSTPTPPAPHHAEDTRPSAPLPPGYVNPSEAPPTPPQEHHAEDFGTYSDPGVPHHAEDTRPSASLPPGYVNPSEAPPTPPQEHHAEDFGTYSDPGAPHHAEDTRPSASLPPGYVNPSEAPPQPLAPAQASMPAERLALGNRTGGAATSSTADSSPLTLPKMSQFDDETEQQGFWGARGGKPTYYQPADRPNPYELEIQDGKFRHKGGEALDTQGILPYQVKKDKAHRHMFTMGGQGELYSADVGQGMQEHGRVHHTTMSGGRETAAAGELRVNQGKLETVSDSSGHYMPGTAMTYQALKNFESRGVDLSATNVELSGKDDDQKALSLSATEMMSYQPEMEAALASARDYRSAHSLEAGTASQRRKQESRIRGILSSPEEKIRAAHAKKDAMLQELRDKTADRRQRLDQSAPAARPGQRDLTEFEYQEEMRGYQQASSSQSRRMMPEQAQAAQAELEAHWQEQEKRRHRG